MEEFRVCPACGYGRGFHLFFRNKGKRMAIGLICPDCGQSFDPGWNVSASSGLQPSRGAVCNEKG